MLNPELTRLVETEIDEDEALLWCGQPDRAYLFIKSIFNIKFLIGLTIILVLFIFSDTVLSSKYESFEKSEAKYVFVLFVIAMFFLIFPFRRFLTETRTIYAVTTKRCLLFKHSNIDLFKKHDYEFYRGITLSRTEPIISFHHKFINEVKSKIRPDNTGDIFLFSDHEYDIGFLKDTIESDNLKKNAKSVYGLIKKSLYNKIIFWGINDVKWVEQTIKDHIEKQKALKKASGSASQIQ